MPHSSLPFEKRRADQEAAELLSNSGAVLPYGRRCSGFPFGWTADDANTHLDHLGLLVGAGLHEPKLDPEAGG
jgi:hypothetical protein